MSQSDGLIAAAWEAVGRDNLPEAKRLALQAVDAATTDREKADSLYVVAETMNRLGEWKDASDWWTRTIEAKNALNFETVFSTLKSGITYFNAGLAYRMVGSHGDALDVYAKALASFIAVSRREYVLSALLNLAWVDCLGTETKRAPIYLAMAQGLVDTQNDRYDLLVGEAFCASRTGDAGAAIDLCRRLLDDAEAPALVKSQAAWVSATTYHDNDDYTNAERMLALAEGYAQALNTTDRNHVMHDVERLKRHIAKAG